MPAVLLTARRRRTEVTERIRLGSHLCELWPPDHFTEFHGSVSLQDTRPDKGTFSLVE